MTIKPKVKNYLKRNERHRGGIPTYRKSKAATLKHFRAVNTRSGIRGLESGKLPTTEAFRRFFS